MAYFPSLENFFAPSGNPRSPSASLEGASKVTKSVLLLLALSSSASSQYTGEVHLQNAVDLGLGFEPMFVASSEGIDLVWGEEMTGLFRQTLGLDGQPIGQKEHIADSPYHSQKAVVYPDGSIGMALEVREEDSYHLDACRWQQGWIDRYCQRISNATTDGRRHSDIASFNGTTVISAHFLRIIRTSPSNPMIHKRSWNLYQANSSFYFTYASQQGGNFPSIISRGNQGFKVVYGTPPVEVDGRLRTQPRYSVSSPVDASQILEDTFVQGASSHDLGFDSFDGTPPHLMISLLGEFDVVSWTKQSELIGNGHNIRLFDQNNTARAISAIDHTEGIVDSGKFYPINATLCFGIWTLETPGLNLARGQFFQVEDQRLRAEGPFITLFESRSDIFRNPTAIALPDEQGLLAAVEKAGRIYVKALHFQQTPETSTQLTTATSTSQPVPPSTTSDLSTSSSTKLSTTQVFTSTPMPPPSDSDPNSPTDNESPVVIPGSQDNNASEEGFDLWMIGPIVGGALCYIAAIALFVHRRMHRSHRHAPIAMSALDAQGVPRQLDSQRRSEYGRAPEAPRSANQYTAAPPALNGSQEQQQQNQYTQAPPPADMYDVVPDGNNTGIYAGISGPEVTYDSAL